jgi:hypothetical protein
MCWRSTHVFCDCNRSVRCAVYWRAQRLACLHLVQAFDDAVKLLEAAERHGWKASMRSAACPYRSGECRDWRKVKTAAWREANASGGGSSIVRCRPAGLSGERRQTPMTIKYAHQKIKEARRHALALPRDLLCTHAEVLSVHDGDDPATSDTPTY